MKKLLDYYFAGKYDSMLGSRIQVLLGDITENNLGLTDIPKVQTVINTAATVKHYGSYKYFYDINVVGTQHAMSVAKSVNARFVHISTLSVSGNGTLDTFGSYRSAKEKQFAESDLYIGQELDNVYIIFAASLKQNEQYITPCLADSVQM